MWNKVYCLFWFILNFSFRKKTLRHHFLWWPMRNLSFSERSKILSHLLLHDVKKHTLLIKKSWCYKWFACLRLHLCCIIRMWFFLMLFIGIRSFYFSKEAQSVSLHRIWCSTGRAVSRSGALFGIVLCQDRF